MKVVFIGFLVAAFFVYGFWSHYLFTTWLRHLMDQGRIRRHSSFFLMSNVGYFMYLGLLFKSDPNPETEALRKPAAVAVGSGGVVMVLAMIIIVVLIFKGF